MKVLLVDDHPLILAALQSVIRGLGDDVTVQGVDSERGARELLAEDPDQDLLLLDLQLGASDGFDLLAELRQQYPALPIVVVSASERASDVIRAIDAGAMGFVPKRASNDTLFEALRMVMSGGIYVPPMTLGMAPAPPAPPKGGDTVPDVMRPHADSGSPPDHRMGDAGHDAPRTFAELGLSRRQADVLAYLLKGMPNKLIAREMHISIETVKDHVAAVLKALGVSSRTQAVLLISQMAQQGGLAGWKTSQR
ncbi:MAG TPA: response regulator transcription factor [Burkholderiaceae bacterium]|nr:response regulator transcription factor [Burkholderiaceae bacterium]